MMKQETNLYAVTLPPVTKALGALSKMLDKAAAHAASKATPHRGAAHFQEALLQSRLVFDQFPLVRQIQIACDNAKAAAGYLGGVEAPAHEDGETTIEELKIRIGKTIAFLKSVEPARIIGKEGTKVSLRYWPDKYLTGFEYATEYLIPNFYFHVTTAYSILRKNGVDVGKADYIGGLPLKG